jgi:NAD(P)-dependent dehydrogenase (short-subunit alcohol dehydrogenase family)
MPLARIGTPDDIANAAAFLLGDESAWITGQILNVDGGHHLRGGPDIDPIVAQLAGADFVASVGLRAPTPTAEEPT